MEGESLVVGTRGGKWCSRRGIECHVDRRRHVIETNTRKTTAIVKPLDRNNSSSCKTKKQEKIRMVKHSENSQDSMDEEGGPSKKVTCASCKNHGWTILLKHHKPYCQYSDCECLMCHLTHNRRRIMAQRLAIKRAYLQDVHHMKEIYSTHGSDVPMIHVPYVIRNFESNAMHANMNYNITIPTSTKFSSTYHNLWSPSYVPRTRDGQSIEQLLEYSAQLGEMLPRRKDTEQQLDLLYVIMKDSKSNFNEALRRIIEAVTAFDLKSSSWDTILTRILSFIIYLSTT